MSIRTYLILSNLVLIILLIFGMMGMARQLSERLTKQSLANAERGSRKNIEASYKIAENVLSVYGQRLVERDVEGAAKALAFRLTGRDLTDFGKLREDESLRRIATRDIETPEGVAGNLLVYDNRGVIVFGRNRAAEGRNVLQWQNDYAETHALIKRSLTEETVKGYFAFFDKAKNKERQRFSVRIHVPGTPFIVSGSVNVDEFFLPAQEKLKLAGEQVMTESRKRFTESSKGIVRQVYLVTLIGGAVLCIMGAFSGLWFATHISRPILGLRDGVREVGEGNFEVAVPEKGAREVAQLAQSFNQLGQQLTDYMEKRDFIRDTFSRYVTQEVVRKLLEDKGALELGGEMRDVSVIMSDLRGFTALTADMHPEKVITFLNRYLGKMIEILVDYNAIIDEIVGDGILAFFGAPEPREDHPVRAVACALAMQLAMEEVNALNIADGLPSLEMGIAVNTGAVVVGNIGSEKRAKYSVVGSHVNFTSRIESYATGGQVLISAATYDRVRDVVEVGPEIEAQMKGVPGRVTIYEVQAIGEPYNIRAGRKSEEPRPLPERIPVQILRITDKIVAGDAGQAWIIQLCRNSAIVAAAGELHQWEDVLLLPVAEGPHPLSGKIYGKVAEVNPGSDALQEALIRFTSVSPEAESGIGRFMGSSGCEV
ncbi:MAG: adenylate/guanylate cyclase domain-containing protein [Desulfobaccales bacterium]